MCLWCGVVFRGDYVDRDGAGGLRCIFGWIYVNVFNGAGDEIRVFWVCDVPISYAETVDYGYGCTSPCTQVCGAGFWVSE